MEHLTKQQIILVALLVSFMTSLATGIFTVSLMSQMPKGVAQTITQVVEKTIQVANTPNASFGTVAITVDDQVSNAVSSVSPSVVRLINKDTSTFLGLGLVVTSKGLILADRSILTAGGQYLGILTDGTRVSFSISGDQPTNQNLAFLAPDAYNPLSLTYTPISFGSLARLGQTVLSLSGTTTSVVSQSIISEVQLQSIAATDPTAGRIVTTIPISKSVSGSPLFTPSGDVIGMELSSLSSPDGVVFYPIIALKSAVSILK